METQGDKHEEPTNTLSLSVSADSTGCTSCGKEVWIGEEACPFCGAPREVGTEAEAHLYRARIAIFGSIAEAFREPIASKSAVPVSDWQYLRFLLDSRVLDVETIDEMQAAMNRLDLSSPEKTRSKASKEAARVLLRSANRFRRVIGNLKSLKPGSKRPKTGSRYPKWGS